MNPTPTTPAPQAGHTPGPWENYAPHGKCSWPGIESPETSIVVYASAHERESNFGIHGRTYEEALANARLIAAAPDLLAFAQRALRIFLAWQHDANPDGDLKPGESADFDAATLNVEAARAALAQAEGRA